MRKPKKQRPPVENQPPDAPTERVVETPSEEPAPLAEAEPVQQELDHEEPATQETVVAETAVEEPVVTETAVEEAVVETPATEAPVIAVPGGDEPIAEKTIAEDQPALADPIAEESIAAKVVTEETKTEAAPQAEEVVPLIVNEIIEEVATKTAQHEVPTAVVPEVETHDVATPEEAVVPEAVVPYTEKEDTKKSTEEDIESETEVDTSPTATSSAVVASSFANKCFNALAWLGPLAALLLLAAQTLPGINLRALWLPTETMLPALLESMKTGADPLLLLLNGAPYPDLPPAYFWFLAGLDSLWQITPLPYSMPLLLLGGSVVAGFLLLFITWVLARVCGSDRREAFAACAVLLCTFVVCSLTRVATPDLLFAACVAASCLCLYSGWMQPRATLTLLLGFLLAGLAMLIAGPAGLVLPLAASLLFLLWRGTFRRAGAADGAFGFAVLLIAIGGWLAWLGLTYGRGPAEALLNHHIPQWSLAFWSDPQRWLCDAITLAVLLLPWPLLLLFLPWERLYRLPVLLWRNRKENPGIGFMWCALLVGLLLLSLTYPGGTAAFALILPFLAVILGRALLRLSPLRSKLFFSLVGLVLCVSAIALGLCSALPFVADWLPADLALPETCKDLASLPGTAFVAGAALLFSLILLKFTDKSFPGGGLLILLLFSSVAMLPVGVLTLPHLAPLNGVVEQAPTPVLAPAESPVVPAESPAEIPETPPTPAEVPTTSEEKPVTEPAPLTTPVETPMPADTSTPPTEATPAEVPAEPVVPVEPAKS